VTLCGTEGTAEAAGTAALQLKLRGFAMTHDNELSRREVLQTGIAAGVAVTIGGTSSTLFAEGAPAGPVAGDLPVTLNINGKDHALKLDPRATLLDTLREGLDLTGTKKGCDHGQCGACTVHVDGQRVLSCLTLAAQCEGSKVVSIEGLANGDQLHPMQQAFVKHDALQCGYCTSGQVMSAVACVSEGHCNSREEVREFMSGNICRCGAYPNIVDAVMEVAGK
jgi:xanthine dehydrogenase YagT iron-sulfur-binding subunit